MNKNLITSRELLQWFFIGLMLIALASCKTAKEAVIIAPSAPTPINSFAFNFVQSDNLKSVLKQAKQENKLVFVDIYTTWCLPCKMMDKDVFTHQETADIINKDFISYKVDAEKSNGPIISFNYDVNVFPTLLFLDSNGDILERKEGAAYHREILSLAQSALDKVVLGD
ncbi:MAG: thioredoxin family protein [Saprospiraceae bacterium]|nr:thioredoxin family protein [Saprospiraceae bacterium]